MEWTAVGLLASLAHTHPDRLGLPVYLPLPDARQYGAIYQATQSGGLIRQYGLRRPPWSQCISNRGLIQFPRERAENWSFLQRLDERSENIYAIST